VLKKIRPSPWPQRSNFYLLEQGQTCRPLISDW
jgi:hypothetical protein